VRIDGNSNGRRSATASRATGPLRLAEIGDDPRALADTIEVIVKGADCCAPRRARRCSWSAGRAAIPAAHGADALPLHIIHQYTIGRRRRRISRILAPMSRARWTYRDDQPQAARAGPLAAMILYRLIESARPTHRLFGLWAGEGYAYSLLPGSVGLDRCRCCWRRAQRAADKRAATGCRNG